MAAQEKNQTLVHRTNSELKPKSISGAVEKAQILFQEEIIISAGHVGSLTIENAGKSAQLSLIKKEIGEKETAVMISKLMNEISLLTNTTMDTPVKMLCAKMILSNYWHLKIDELLLVIRDGVLGRYGKIYGNFCFTTLTEWIEKYQAEKLGYVEDKNLSHTSHEKVIRDREIGINPQEQEIKPIAETLSKINDFWKDAEIKP